MSWVETLKDSLPEYAKDIKLNLDAVINRGSFDFEFASALALAAAVQTGNGKLVNFIASGINDEIEKNAAMTAGSLMAQNNIWYPYLEMLDDESVKNLPAQLRMNSIASHGGTTKIKFESYALIASIIGKCHFCIKGHANTLKQEGYSPDQFKDLGRIASVVNGLAKVLSA